MQLYMQRVRTPSSSSCAIRPTLKASSRSSLRAVAEKEAKKTDDKAKEFEHDVPHPVVSTKQVETFLSTLVNDTAIAELQLQVGSFELKVKRNIGGVKGATVAAPIAAPAAPAPAYEAPVALSATVENVGATESIDESLMPVTSPKVGIFRRGKFAGGKRVGKGNAVDEGAQIKKGQILGYVEQLGTYFAVEAPQAGEVAKFLIEDGAPVSYQEVVVELAPFFGGHIIGESKHA